MPSLPTLAELPVGKSSTIASVRDSGPSVIRLQELGLVPGTQVTMVRRAPLGEPIEIEVRGSRLAMRNHEAVYFTVEAELK
ncbi:MAG: ferrous iron transport protein A [Verrucomicrobiaceae bacterium]|nr:ferrous iron transport protein A [Verrucomicrobiaceae bacterium]